MLNFQQQQNMYMKNFKDLKNFKNTRSLKNLCKKSKMQNIKDEKL